MKNFPTCHCHPQSLDSASTLKAFVAREKELGTGYITVTDHGTMQACRAVYDLAKKNDLTPILGLEAYFRDDNCDILKGFGITDVPAYWKYAHITLHARDQEAYEALVKVLSNACLNRMERHGSEEKPIFNWADLEELSKYNITCGSGCLIGMVQRHFLVGHEKSVQIAEAYYLRLKAIFDEDFYVEVFPHHTDKNWVSGIFLTTSDGSTLKFYGGKKLLVDGEEVKAEDLAARWKEGNIFLLQGVKHYSKWEENFEAKSIIDVRKVEDFIQNECFPWCPDGDSQKGTNRMMLILAKKHDTKVLISDDSHFANPEDKIVQDIRLQATGGSWRFYESYHRQSSEEAFKYFSTHMSISQDVFEGWVENNYEWAARFKGFNFKARRDLPVKFYPGDPLARTKKLIDKHGRMDWSNQVYVQRLKDEINMLHNNGTIDLLPYFFPIEEVADLYEKNELLTGPGRGSAAGLLLTYLLGITHVDPIKYGLSKERFLTLDRIKGGKLPDIDFDLPHRDLLVNPDDPSKGWLKDRFGDCVAQISTDTMLKIRSSIKDVARVFGGGRVDERIAKLAAKIPQAPQGIEDHDFVFGYKANEAWVPGIIESDPALIEYIRDYPEQWEVVQKCLGLTRQKSRHACAFVITNEPVANFIPLTKIKDHVVTQYTAKSVEAAGGLKMDFLIINILNDISAAIKMVQAQHGGIEKRDYILNGKRVPWFRVVPFNGELYDVWDLPAIQGVFHDFCESDTETVFQFNTPAARGWLRQFNYTKNTHGDKALDSINSLAAFTALDRPGPLDYVIKDESGREAHNMLVEYARRARGEQPLGAMEALNKLLPETHGVIVYQEQLQKIYQTLGKTTAVKADEFRVHIGKKMMQDVYKDKADFMPGATEAIGAEQAEVLWQSMETFGQYGFNKSHAVCYVTISYACAFLKHFYPLQWWCAVLQNADRNEIDEKFWRYCGHLVNLPDIRKSSDTFEITGDRIQAPLWLLHGVGKGAQEEIQAGRPYADVSDFVRKIRDRRIAKGTKVTKVLKATRKRPEQTVEALKLGHSALNRGVITTMIVSGAMDGLFPEETSVYEKMALYEQVWAEVNELKKPRPVDNTLASVHQLVRFQMRKTILPAYSAPILPMLVERQVPRIVDEGNGVYSYDLQNGDYATRFVTAAQFERLNSLRLLPGKITVAMACYVVATRPFKYGPKKDKQAVEFILDHDGNRVKMVKWPNNQGKLPKDFPADCAGAIVVALATKLDETRDFALNDIIVVQPPLGDINEESKETSNE